MFKSTKRLVTLAMFTAMALVIFVVEAQIPVPVPIPGVKLGLSNIITLFVLVKYRGREALTVLVLRILMGSFFTGHMVSFFYSLSGGMLCFLGMWLLCRVLRRKHVWFISVMGAILHNIGQILAAMLVMQSVQVVYYLPFLLLTGILTGLFTGLAAQAILRHLGRMDTTALERQ